MTLGYELPPGWTIATVGELVERIETGKSPRCDTRPASVHERGVIKVSAMTWGEFAPSENKALLPGANFDPQHEIRGGDLLVSRANTAAYVGAAVVVPGHVRSGLLLSDKSLRLVPAPGVTPEWLMYALRTDSARRQIEQAATGTKDSMRNISQDKLRAIVLAVPPANEQLRVVAALEERLSHLDATVTAVRRLAGRMRQLQDAALSQLLADSGSERAPLGELLREPLRNGLSAPASNDPTGVRVLTLTAVTRRDFGAHHTKVTSADPGKARGLWCEPGDIFIQRSNTPELVGSAALYNGPRNFAIFPDLLIRVRVTDVLDRAYLELVLRAPQTRRYFRDHAQGLAGSMPKISQTTIASLLVPTPPLARQEALRDRALGLVEQAEKAAGALRLLEMRCTALRSSLLRAACTGGLAEQDPTEEPADLFLKRIAENRALAQSAVTRRRGRTVTAAREILGTTLVEELA